MHRVSSHKVGLVVGSMLAIWHAVWSILVATGLAKPLYDWTLGLHFITLQYSINPFDWGHAITLVIVTYVIGYIVGSVLGWLWNWAHRTGK